MVFLVIDKNETDLDKGTEQLAKTAESSDKLHLHTTTRKSAVQQHTCRFFELTLSLWAIRFSYHHHHSTHEQCSWLESQMILYIWKKAQY